MQVSDFSEGWVGSPIEKWVAILIKSGVLFWLGGLLAVAYDKKWLISCTLDDWLVKGYKSVPTLLSIFGFMVLVAISGNIIKRFDLFTLRFLEGYYLPGWIKKRQTRHLDKWLREEEKRLDVLIDKLNTPHEKLDAYEVEEYIRLDEQITYTPDEGERLPTQLGNLLRGFELRSRDKYGLDAFVCWHRLWLLLPDHAKREIAKARYGLDTSVRIWNWGLLFMIWTIWAWWAAPISLVIMYLVHRWILDAARIYGQLIESAFDLYRHLLYKELRFPLPENPLEEREYGELLTKFLWRGAGDKTPMFESYRMD